MLGDGPITWLGADAGGVGGLGGGRGNQRGRDSHLDSGRGGGLCGPAL